MSYDLTFPEVFYPNGVPYGRQGFHAVVGNPPWDRMLPADKEFFASYEFAILDAPTKRERDAIQNRLTKDAATKDAYLQYIEGFRGAERAVDTLFTHQVAVVNGEKTIGKQDLFRLFMERMSNLAISAGLIGVVVPSAFHANEGATAVRQLYFNRMALRCCYSFENRRALFEIHRSFKFALIVGVAGSTTTKFSCAFYLHDDEWLFGQRDGREPLVYGLDFVQRTGGEYLTLLELRSRNEFAAAEVCFAKGEPFGQVCERAGIRLGRELNMSDDAWRFTVTTDVLDTKRDPRNPDVASQLQQMGYLVLHEGKTFWQFDDRWGDRPRFLVPISQLSDRREAVLASRYYRAAYRDISGSTNERTLVYSLLCPGCVIGDTAKAPERNPQDRPGSVILAIIGVCNAYVPDFLVRLRAASHVSLFMLRATPLPTFAGSIRLFFAHSALRLTCNHSGYEPLWREQVGEAWREEGKPPMTWPVLAGDDERWAIRAAIDAVVADAYGLSRDQYAHVLATFSHASYRKAPELCLARFDELKSLGLEKFTRKHDPYWDIPLNENLPQPVIDLPIPKDETAEQTDDGRWKERSGQISFLSPGPIFDQKSDKTPAQTKQEVIHHPYQEYTLMPDQQRPFEKRTYVGFVDVLGYRSIVLNPQRSEAEKFHYLVESVYQNLTVAARLLVQEQDPQYPVAAVHFSDSYYFQSDFAPAIVTAMADFFAQAAAMFRDTYLTENEWQPFLRGGIVHDWMVETCDVTLPALQEPRHAFRNPVGPAVAKAYELAEESNIQGMRLALSSEVAKHFQRDKPLVDRHSVLGIKCSPLVPLKLKEHKKYGTIYEVPWFELNMLSDNMGGDVGAILHAERQFDVKVMKHFRGTLDAILRSPSVQGTERLRCRLEEIREQVRRGMALRSWEDRGKPLWDDWYDWFIAEGLIEPKKDC